MQNNFYTDVIIFVDFSAKLVNLTQISRNSFYLLPEKSVVFSCEIP